MRHLYVKLIHGGKAKNDRIDANKIALILTEPPTVPGSHNAERRHARDQREQGCQQPKVWDSDPADTPAPKFPTSSL